MQNKSGESGPTMNTQILAGHANSKHS